MTPLRLIRLVMSRAHGLGISTTCYPSPAPVHRSLSSNNERLKLCPRVQTPAPVLGRLHATVPGILADPDGLYQTWWWGSAHSITRRHVRNLRLHPARQCSIPPPAPWCGQPDLLTARAANLITSQELTVPVGCSYRTHITVCLYNGYITGANVKALCSGIFSNRP